MTDNEIIKALECCSTYGVSCTNCPAYVSSEKSTCREVLKGAVEIINRQKAEIEELETEIDKQYEQAKADILGNMADGGVSCHWCIEEHRANAIKECFEKVRERLAVHSFTSNSTEYTDGQLDCMLWVDSEIYELEKEMVGAE